MTNIKSIHGLKSVLERTLDPMLGRPCKIGWNAVGAHNEISVDDKLYVQGESADGEERRTGDVERWVVIDATDDGPQWMGGHEYIYDNSAAVVRHVVAWYLKYHADSKGQGP